MILSVSTASESGKEDILESLSCCRTTHKHRISATCKKKHLLLTCMLAPSLIQAAGPGPQVRPKLLTHPCCYLGPVSYPRLVFSMRTAETQEQDGGSSGPGWGLDLATSALLAISSPMPPKQGGIFFMDASGKRGRENPLTSNQILSQSWQIKCPGEKWIFLRWSLQTSSHYTHTQALASVLCKLVICAIRQM